MLDLLLYSSIRDYIYARITFFTEQVLSTNLTLAITIILSLMTLWVMIQGFLIVTGRSQEGLKGFLFNIGKAYFIVAVALGVAAGGSFGVRALTEELADGISTIMTGDTEVGKKCLLQNAQIILGCKIDQNLTATQSMMGILSNIDTADDDYLEEKLTEARWFAGIGTAGPAIVAGTMLIIFRIAMALFVGFAPIFILCLLFKKTAPLFQKWLYYGIATLFSGVMLGVMADISMDLVSNITSTSMISDAASFILTGKGSTGIMQTVTQQLGLGLVLSSLLITVPPMAGLWFNGMMGSYTGYGVFDRSGALPPGVDGGRSYQQQVEQKVHNRYEQLGQNYGNQSENAINNTTLRHNNMTNLSASTSQSTDVMRTNSQLAQHRGLEARTPQPKPENKETK